MVTHVKGWDQNPENLSEAKKLEIIDDQSKSEIEAITDADWVFLATPVDAIESRLPYILDKITTNQIIVDFGSTKSKICEVVKDHPNRNQYIAAHPIAGTEYSGPAAAFSTLFENKVMIICDRDGSDPKKLLEFQSICGSLKMKLSFLGSKEHDMHLAYVSHLSHVIAFSLSNTVLDKEKEEQQILDLAGSGFDSTVRLAKSSPEMWAPIFIRNKEYLLASIDDFIERVQSLRETIDHEDENAIYHFLNSGREIMKIIR